MSNSVSYSNDRNINTMDADYSIDSSGGFFLSDSKKYVN